MCQQTAALFTPSVRCQNRENKKRQTKSPHHSEWRRRGENTQGKSFFFLATLFPHFARVHLHVLLPQFLSHSFCLCFSFSLVLSLCGILAAILALGSHLSFGGTHAFLLADGTPTHTHSHTHTNRHTCLQSTLSLTHRPSGLKDKKTYRGYAIQME